MSCMDEGGKCSKGKRVGKESGKSGRGLGERERERISTTIEKWRWAVFFS